MWTAGGLLAALAVVAVALAVLARRAEPYLRARIVEELTEHFHARVELDAFHISLRNGLWAEGKGLRIWPPAQVEGVAVPGPGGPLLSLDEFRFRAPLRYEPGKPVRIPMVQLKGMHINVPPKSHFGHPAGAPAGPGKSMVHFEVDQMECTGADLVIGTSKPGKLPLEFVIAHFKLTGIGSGGPIHPKDQDPSSGAPAMAFDAELTNPRPVGKIHSTGFFGPWKVADPGESPITGDYRFDHADLAVFKGIAGILNSTGRYQGTLRELVADGDADVPDFRLTHYGSAVPLHTHFHARVDATNGDTWLEPVDAILGHSHFTAQGQIVRVPASDAPGAPSLGHDIALRVNVERARIEDFLQLASSPQRTTPLLTGNVAVKANLHVPPGPGPVNQKMTLAGTFDLDQVRFTSAKIQKWIEELSLRGQGRPGDLKTTDSATMRSRMEGTFKLGGGVMALPALRYTVPGADIQLSGNYGVDDGALDFAGTVKLDAPVSKVVGGWKGLLLKPADRFFRKDGAGTEVPIHIEGTREEPKFGIDFDKMTGRSGDKR
jgi:hypothetical protein